MTKWTKKTLFILRRNISRFYCLIQSALDGKCSTAQNSSARKPVFQANLQISLAVFKKCMADMLGFVLRYLMLC
jgi:hypothetical protein